MPGDPATGGMRIVISTSSSPWSGHAGGGTTVVHYLATGLSRRGHDVTVLYMGPGIPPGRERPEYDVAFFSRGRANWFIFDAARQARQAAKQRPLDILHVHGAEGALFTTAVPDTPLVATTHSVLNPAIRPTFFVPPPDYRRRPLSWWSACVGAAAASLTLRRADHVVCVSSFSRETAQRNYKLPDEKVSVIHNGVDVTRAFAYAPPREIGGPARVLYCGRVVPEKRWDVFIETVARLARARPIEAAVVGDGTSLPAMMRLAEALGLHHTVRFVGRLDHTDPALAAWYQWADVVLMPSEYESFGMFVLEAGACGRPTVCSDIPGVQDHMVDGLSGTLVRPGDAAAFAEATLVWLALPVEERVRRARKARRRVEEKFSWERSLDAHEALYQKVRASRAATPFAGGNADPVDSNEALGSLPT